MKIFKDERVVLTLDAGGTNFVFSALKGGRPVTPLFTMPSNSNDLDKCLKTIIKGFEKVQETLLPSKAVAISFAFPGPAAYLDGVILNPPNFPSFKGGVALGPMLEDHFNLPTFINNDGDLFTYGEAIGGLLPEINKGFRDLEINRSFKNLIGITLGTGFGGGIVINNQICLGDNSAGGEVWLMRNVLEPEIIAEESVSVRGIQYYYQKLSGVKDSLSPKQIFQIAIGEREGDQNAAMQSYDNLARVAAEALANIINLIDGAVVIGGGIAGSSNLLLPKILKYLNGEISSRNGEKFKRVVSPAFSFEDVESRHKFFNNTSRKVKIPYSNREIEYVEHKGIPIGISRLGTNDATMLGAYAIALNHIGKYSLEHKKEEI